MSATQKYFGQHAGELSPVHELSFIVTLRNSAFAFRVRSVPFF